MEHLFDAGEQQCSTHSYDAQRPLQQGLACALGLLLDAVHVDTDQTAVSLDGPAGDEHGIHVAAVHPQDDGADRVVDGWWQAGRITPSRRE